jgi:hypothetical protein
VKFIFSVAVCILLFSCKNSKKEIGSVKEEMVYDMYEPSEMSILMNDMYEYNLKLKQEIIDGKIPSEFPSKFLEIHTAQLSEFKSRNEKFQAYSQLFIEHQQDIFNSDSNINISERYNRTINLCVTCHTTECTGPIPKIKKLLIK